MATNGDKSLINPAISEPILGSLYNVLMTDGTWQVAEIIQRRNNGELKRNEYYVHYKECKNNRRLTTPILIELF